MRKGEETRTRILDVAEAAVLQKGFGGTSIEELIAETGITKSGFFYHSGTRTSSPRRCSTATSKMTSASTMRSSAARAS